MNPYIKEMLWTGWVWLVATSALISHHSGEISGYWTIVICWMCLGYFLKSMMSVEPNRT